MASYGRLLIIRVITCILAEVSISMEPFVISHVLSKPTKVIHYYCTLTYALIGYKLLQYPHTPYCTPSQVTHHYSTLTHHLVLPRRLHTITVPSHIILYSLVGYTPLQYPHTPSCIPYTPLQYPHVYPILPHKFHTITAPSHTTLYSLTYTHLNSTLTHHLVLPHLHTPQQYPHVHPVLPHLQTNSTLTHHLVLPHKFHTITVPSHTTLYSLTGHHSVLCGWSHLPVQVCVHEGLVDFLILSIHILSPLPCYNHMLVKIIHF